MKKFLIGSLMLSCFAFSAPPLNEARLLLGHLRGGDYAHAGDEEAIDLVISKVLELSPQTLQGPCLDVGSGFGGTASYLHRLHFSSTFGIDLDEAAVRYAQEHYPQITFTNGNAHQVTEFFDPDYFSFIYLFNVLYAVEDKPSLLKKLSKVAQPGALLAIFDYTTTQADLQLNDLAGKPMYPIVVSELKSVLKETGWELIEITDLSPSFLTWYRILLKKLEAESPLLSIRFSESSLTKVRTTFRTIENWLSSSLLGGVVIYAKRTS